MFVDNSNETDVVGKDINIVRRGYCDSDFELQDNKTRRTTEYLQFTLRGR